jgi:hypothetical protein
MSLSHFSACSARTVLSVFVFENKTAIYKSVCNRKFLWPVNWFKFSAVFLRSAASVQLVPTIQFTLQAAVPTCQKFLACCTSKKNFIFSHYYRYRRLIEVKIDTDLILFISLHFITFITLRWCHYFTRKFQTQSLFLSSGKWPLLCVVHLTL